MINPLFLTDRKRGRFLSVKRAKAHVIPTSFFERHMIGDDLDNGGAVANLGDFILADHLMTGYSRAPRADELGAKFSLENILSLPN